MNFKDAYPLIMLTLFLGLIVPWTAISEESSDQIAKDLQDQKAVFKSLSSFVDDNPLATDELEYVVSQKEENARKKMEILLIQAADNSIASKNSAQEIELSGGTVDYITRKLNLSLVYFYESKYWLTVKECDNVIKVQPSNALAWTRRGSAHFMLGDYKAAIQDWQIALKLKPSPRQEQELIAYISRINSYQ